MKTLLQLPSLYLSYFRLDKTGNWTFVVSGDHKMMQDWVGV
jgi:hypothetical protein